MAYIRKLSTESKPVLFSYSDVSMMMTTPFFRSEGAIAQYLAFHGSSDQEEYDVNYRAHFERAREAEAEYVITPQRVQEARRLVTQLIDKQTMRQEQHELHFDIRDFIDAVIAPIQFDHPEISHVRRRKWLVPLVPNIDDMDEDSTWTAVDDAIDLTTNHSKKNRPMPTTKDYQLSGFDLRGRFAIFDRMQEEDADLKAGLSFTREN